MSDLIDLLEGNSASGGIGRGNGDNPFTFGINQDGEFVGTASFDAKGATLTGAVIVNDQNTQIVAGGSLGVYKAGGAATLKNFGELETASIYGGIGRSTPSFEIESLNTSFKGSVDARATVSYELIRNDDGNPRIIQIVNPLPTKKRPRFPSGVDDP